MASNHTLISKDTRIQGDIHFDGELNVQGQVIGNIIAGDNAELEISQTGLVEGQIQAPKVVVRGQVKGDLRCTKHLELGATSVVNGNVYYVLIEMVKGSQVNGSLIRISEAEAKKSPNNPS
jgi:cytoskeletal protein CcmA (bactofilin family)